MGLLAVLVLVEVLSLFAVLGLGLGLADHLESVVLQFADLLLSELGVSVFR